eukprot:COSAG02_NODE_642_length_19038_cov_10.020856_12_plen_188_part_00
MSRARVTPRAGRDSISFLTRYCQEIRAVADLFGRRGGPEPRRTGIPCEIAWNGSSHSILNEFMHAEYGIFVYTIWPLSGLHPMVLVSTHDSDTPVQLYARATQCVAASRRCSSAATRTQHAAVRGREPQPRASERVQCHPDPRVASLQRANYPWSSPAARIRSHRSHLSRSTHSREPLSATRCRSCS